jgi:AmpD protein
MEVDRRSGRLTGARWSASANFDARPRGIAIDLVVIHGISLPPGEFGGGEIEAFFCNRLDREAHPYFKEICDQRVSTHLLIRRDGEVVQFVSLNERAWHAGASCYEGRDNCNDFAIGIELEGTDEQPYTDHQYRQLANVLNALISAYPALTRERVVGHCDIAPDRKTDPGPAFDWERLSKALP